MPRAIRFDRYGDRDVLYIADVAVPEPAVGEVVVEVRAAGINPGEAAIRNGTLQASFPATFPSGEGSDLAGVVSTVGDGVAGFAVGDEVMGWSWRRSSQAEYVAVPVTQLIPKPTRLSWEAAGSLYVVGCTAYAAVRAVDAKRGDTIAVSGAAGGVGSVVVQLLRTKDATVLGIASPANHHWLAALGVVPVSYGDGIAERLRSAAPNGIDAFIDLFGPEYVQLAVDLGVAKDRIETIAAREKAQELGTKAEGSVDASTTDVLSQMAELVASGQIEIPIAATYPLEKVRDAFAELEKRHTHGKIVLIPSTARTSDPAHHEGAGMPLSDYFVEPPADWLFRPHGRVVALLDDEHSLVAALEELARDQVPRNSVYLLGGADGVEHIDPSGRHHGLRGRISRLVDTIASEGGDIEDDCRHVEAGGYLIAVRAPRAERTPIVETLRAHGGHSIRYFGPLTTVDLSN